MAIKIEKRIVGYAVQKPEDAAQASSKASEPKVAEVVQMHERLERPDRLEGTTYKIKSPLFEHALYLTINDIVLNPDTPHEHRRPFEVFINSKNLEHFQWAVALTRIMSAVFRKGGDVTFLVEELKAVFDPRGGYYKAGGIYMPSIVAELGCVIEDHLKYIGMLKSEPVLLEPKSEFAPLNEHKAVSLSSPAAICPKCSSTDMKLMDGCMTCLSCGYSKCG
jgi:hypothetical protein